MVRTAQRTEKLSPNFFVSLGATLARLEAEGKRVIHLDIGSPDLPPDPGVIAELSHSASQENSHGYQSHKGPVELREAWADMYARVYGVSLDPETEIIPLIGSKEGIFHLMLALINPGDIVLIPNPGYITYTQGTLFAGGDPYELPLLEDHAYLPDLSAIPESILRHARLLWLNYPNNPTAAEASYEFFSHAVEFCRQNQILLCHDAAYTQVTFDGYRAPSILRIPGAKDIAIEFNTLSKSHNMAGWRVAAAVGNPDVLKALFKLKSNLDSGHFLPVLQAAIRAMRIEQAWLDARNEVYQQRRNLVIKSLHSIGLKARVPRAAIYVWCPVPAGLTSEQFAMQTLQGAQVSLTPGTVFGRYGEGYVRIALTAPTDQILAAMQRLERWIGSCHCDF